MEKKNKLLLILTSLVTLIPAVVGLILWNRLPEEIATHWNILGQVDGYSSRGMAVLGFPALMLVIHWLCVVLCKREMKSGSKKPLIVIYWCVPAVSLLIGFLTLGTALAMELDAKRWLSVFLGGMFLVIGNILPKCPPSRRVGLKLVWTLRDPDNWFHTHRFAGVVWVIGGMGILLTSLWVSMEVVVGILLVMVVLPVGYSWLYDVRKKRREGHEGI